MATDLETLVPMLDQETGNELEDAQLLTMLTTSVPTLNVVVVDEIVLTGSLADRDLTPLEQRLLVLFSTGTYIRGEAIKAAKNAVVHANVAGRTQLNFIPQELRLLLKAVADEIKALLAHMDSVGIIGDSAITELGETLAITGMPTAGYPSGFGWWWGWR